MTIVQTLGSPVTSGTIILFLWRDWGEETEEREDGKGRRKRREKGWGRRRSHHHTQSSMEWCELKLRKVQLDKPSEKKALGSSVAKSHAWHCQSLMLKQLHWFRSDQLPSPVPLPLKLEHRLCKFWFLRILWITQPKIQSNDPVWMHAKRRKVKQKWSEAVIYT